MQLDSTLRAALLGEGDAIVADPAAALPRIVARSRAVTRRRTASAVAACVALAAASWSLTAAPPALRDEVPPAEERRDPIERNEAPLPDDEPSVRNLDGAPREDASTTSGRVRAGSARAPVSRASGADAPSAPRATAPDDQPPAAEGAASPLAPPRRLSERYDVAYVAGTHVGENVGTGCSQGEESVMRSNDCIAIVIDDDESEISLSLVDDEGIVAGAEVSHYVDGKRTDLGSFCGETPEPLAVEPGALLLVYVDTSSRCSDQRPGTGTLLARIR